MARLPSGLGEDLVEGLSWRAWQARSDMRRSSATFVAIGGGMIGRVLMTSFTNFASISGKFTKLSEFPKCTFKDYIEGICHCYIFFTLRYKLTRFSFRRQHSPMSITATMAAKSSDEAEFTKPILCLPWNEPHDEVAMHE